MSNDEYTALTGCFQATDGTWFFPYQPTDQRIPGGPILSNKETIWVREIKAIINDQMDGLWAQFDLYWQGELRRIEEQATNGAGRLVPGYGPSDQGSIATVYTYYAPLADAYLRNPDVIELTTYVAWWFNRRLSAAPASNGSQMYDQAARNYLQYDRLPWPWDLADPVNMAAFFRWALDNGIIEPQPNESTTPSTKPGEEDCVADAYWLAPTQERIEAVNSATGALGPETDGPILRRLAEEIRGIATAQSMSEPPQSARALNVLILNTLEDLAAAYDEHADVMEQQLPYEDFEAASDHLNEAKEEFRQASSLVSDEAARCGISNPADGSS